jgi:hypothetical protein
MRSSLAFFGFVLATLVPLAARAQAPSADVEVARGAFLQAERAFQEQRYEEALSLFRLAFAKVPNDAVRFNVGVCLERLGRYAEARSEYEAAASSTSLSAEQRAAGQERAQALAPRTAELILSGAAQAVRVSVDGAPACTTPCRAFVEPGRHQLTADTAGGPISLEVEAVAGTAHAVAFEGRSVPAPPPETAPSGRGAGGEPSAPVMHGSAPRRDSRGVAPGWLTLAGGITTGVGVAGVVGFGLRTRSLESSYHSAPSAETRDAGLRTQTLTNASIVMAGVGAALVVLDLLVFETGRSRSVQIGADRMQWAF